MLGQDSEDSNTIIKWSETPVSAVSKLETKKCDENMRCSVRHDADWMRLKEFKRHKNL